MVKFKYGETVIIQPHWNKRLIPFRMAIIRDKGDQLNDPDVLAVGIRTYPEQGVGEERRYYPREWIRKKPRLNPKETPTN